MAFWSDANSPEPKRSHRWYMKFNGNQLLSNIRYACKKVDKPKAKIGQVTHKYLNHFFYYPGRLEWEEINLTLASVSDPDATESLMAILALSGYYVPQFAAGQPKDAVTIGKNKFAGAIGSIEIIQVNADGVDVETWELFKPFFTSVQWGSLDYENENIVDIQLGIRYDYARLNKTLPTVGNPL